MYSDCVNSVRTAKDRDVTAHANLTFTWADFATERELFDLAAPSSTDVPILLLNHDLSRCARYLRAVTSLFNLEIILIREIEMVAGT